MYLCKGPLPPSPPPPSPPARPLAGNVVLRFTMDYVQLTTVAGRTQQFRQAVADKVAAEYSEAGTTVRGGEHGRGASGGAGAGAGGGGAVDWKWDCACVRWGAGEQGGKEGLRHGRKERHGASLVACVGLHPRDHHHVST